MCCGFVVILEKDAPVTARDLWPYAQELTARLEHDPQRPTVGLDPDGIRVISQGGRGHNADPQCWYKALKVAASIHAYTREQGWPAKLWQSAKPCPDMKLLADRDDENVHLERACMALLHSGDDLPRT